GVLGGALAEGLANAGANVVVLGRNKERGEQRVKKICDAGGKAGFICADAMSRESLRDAREQIETTYGPVTILVNAAGGNDPKVTVVGEKSFEGIALEDWRNNFDMNLVG